MPVPISPHEHLAHLVRRAQAGERAAFDELYRKTAQVQYFTIVGKIGEAAAPDVLQEVYLVAWRNIGKINPRSVVAYLNATARNLCRKHLRDSSAPSAAVTASDDELELMRRNNRSLAGGGDGAGDPAETVTTQDEHERLARAMQEHLTDQERDVLLMRYYQNLKLTDIAEQTGLSLSTVKRTINQALATLRMKMGAAELPFGLADVLARAVEVRMLPDVEGATSPGERAAQWGTRAVGAVALAAALGAVAVALQPIEPPEEVLPADPIPTAEAPADTTPPTVAAQEIQNGLVVLTIADDVSGVADAWCIDANDTVHHPLDATGADTLRTYRFQLPSGTYELHVADAAGNTIHGPLEVLVYPEE